MAVDSILQLVMYCSHLPNQFIAHIKMAASCNAYCCSPKFIIEGLTQLSVQNFSSLQHMFSVK